MGAALGNMTLIKYDNLVCIPDGAESMRDN